MSDNSQPSEQLIETGLYGQVAMFKIIEQPNNRIRSTFIMTVNNFMDKEEEDSIIKSSRPQDETSEKKDANLDESNIVHIGEIEGYSITMEKDAVEALKRFKLESRILKFSGDTSTRFYDTEEELSTINLEEKYLVHVILEDHHELRLSDASILENNINFTVIELCKDSIILFHMLNILNKPFTVGQEQTQLKQNRG